MRNSYSTETAIFNNWSFWGSRSSRLRFAALKASPSGHRENESLNIAVLD